MRVNGRGSLTGVVVTLALGLLCSAAAMFLARNMELESIRRDFQTEMELRYTSLVRELNQQKEILFGIRGLFYASKNVSRDEFNAYVAPVQQRYPELQAVEWIPRVRHSERRAFEEAARSEGFSTYSINEINEKGRAVPAGKREEYFPVYYLYPLFGNEVVLGYDLGSNPVRLEAINESRESGRDVVSSRIQLLQDSSQQFAYLHIIPVYNQFSATAAARKKNLKGFVLGVFRIADIFTSALFKVSRQGLGLNMDLIDESANDENSMLYYHKARASGPSRLDFAYQKSLIIGGRQWTLRGWATEDFVNRQRTMGPYLVLAAGLVITLLLVAFLWESRKEVEVSRSAMDSIIDASLHPIIMIDDQARVTLFNPAAEDMFGYTADEVMGKNVKMLMPEPYHEEHDAYVSRFMRTREAKIIGKGREVVGKRRDGSMFPIFLSVSEMPHASRNLGRFLGMLIDITELKQAQEELLAAKEEAESANRMKSEFLNVMSHELRTPLTVILGYMPLLMNPVDTMDSTMVSEIAREMNKSGKHLLTLINDLLDLSKIEAGAMGLELQQVEAQEIIKDVAEAFAEQMDAKTLVLDWYAEPQKVYADPVRFRQILYNLVGNAVKFTDQGGINIRAARSGDMMVFHVGDTGIGIAVEDQKRIFDAFRQADSSASRKAEGTGLGLAITQKLVEMQGGWISVHSRPGEGSTFTFTLPVLSPEGKEQA